MENINNQMNEFSTINLGWRAFQILKNTSHWVVWGNTSKGLFLKGKPEGLIFLSYENFRGPLTVNLAQDIFHYLEGLEIGSTVDFNLDTGLIFEKTNLRLIIDNQFLWQPEPFIPASGGMNIWNNLNVLTGWLKAATPTGSFGHTSSFVVSEETSNGKEQTRLILILRDLFEGLKEYNFQRFYQSAQKLIGLGAGLTPSGDDFLAGMGLAIARYSKEVPILKRCIPWFDALIPLFKERTTILSSELFKVSLLGSADERLIGAFDAVMRINMTKEDVIPAISSWGSSSGFDALSGFYFLMKAIQP